MSGYVADRAKEMEVSPIRRIAELSARVKDGIPFHSGDPAFDTPSHIREAAKKALDDGYTHYSGSPGLLELREAISQKISRDHDIEYNPKTEIVVTEGGTWAIYLSLLTTINPGDEVLVPNPFFPSFPSLVKLVGGVAKFYSIVEEEGEYCIDISDIESKITERTKMVVLNSPHNPTGAILTSKEVEAVADLVRHEDVLVLSDEIYEKVIFEGRRHISIASIPEMKERVVTIQGFSKTYAMTGWRLAYIAAPSELAEPMARMEGVTHIGANTFVQKAAVAALKGPQEEIVKMVDELRKRRNVMIDELNRIEGIRCIRPFGGLFAFPDVSEMDLSEDELVSYLAEEAHVFCVPGSAFGENGRGHIRLTYALPHEKMVSGLKRMHETIAHAKITRRR